MLTVSPVFLFRCLTMLRMLILVNHEMIVIEDLFTWDIQLLAGGWVIQHTYCCYYCIITSSRWFLCQLETQNRKASHKSLSTIGNRVNPKQIGGYPECLVVISAYIENVDIVGLACRTKHLILKKDLELVFSVNHLISWLLVVREICPLKIMRMNLCKFLILFDAHKLERMEEIMA